MYQIRDWLFISGSTEAADKSILKEHKIKALLSLHLKTKTEGVDTLFLPVQEGIPLPAATIQQGVAFVQAQHTKNRPVLIACGMGVSRSVTFTTAVLHVVENIPLHEAFLSIHAKHAKALPDHVHWDSLLALYGPDWDYWTLWRQVVGEA
jgi:protein-tyrosine phosphatase